MNSVEFEKSLKRVYKKLFSVSDGLDAITEYTGMLHVDTTNGIAVILNNLGETLYDQIMELEELFPKIKD